MESGLFAYILKYSKRQQVVLTLMTVAAFPFYYLSLDLPKTIINDAISGESFPVDVEFTIAGLTASLGTFEQIPYLLLLCFAFLLLVLANSGFKLFINIYRGVLGERMLRRLRFQLIERIMKFPLARFRSTSQGELVSMVNQETEPLGGFIGAAFSLPLYQGGLLLTILTFMFMQDWKLGLAAIALYPVQGWLIPKLQRQVNQLNQKRTIRMRKLAENLGEVVAGINEIHINDNSNFFKDHFSKLLGGIFNIRVQIYKKKFFIKFLNNSIAQLTPFLFFLIGGLLVIRGDLSIGALVAALAAYKDLSPPWKELLGWYQSQADARLKYTILTEQFYIDESTPIGETAESSPWSEDVQQIPIVANNITLKRHDGVRELNNISLTVGPGEWISLVGTGTSGKNGLAQLIARLVDPTSGRLLLAEQDALLVPRTVTGRVVSYAGHDSYLFAGSIRDNLLLSLKFKPQDSLLDTAGQDESISFKDWHKEARLSGNSEVDLNADWVDHHSAGANDAAQLNERIKKILHTVNVEGDLVRYALEHTIDPEDHPELAAQILQARELFQERIADNGFDSIVEFLDPEHYNDNASLAENILFGASNHEEFSSRQLAEHPALLPLLEEFELIDFIDDAAVSTATTMVELFSDLPAGHEFFERYGFVDADDLRKLKRILSLLEKKTPVSDLETADRRLLRSLPYGLIRGRHRLGILQESDKKKILQLRKAFSENLDPMLRQRIDFFSPDAYNALTPIGENILFGRIAYGRLGAEDKVYELILDVLQSMNLVSPLLEIGLDAPTGLAGSLLPVSQRQKLVLARALIKQPKVLVINEGLSALDTLETESILTNVKEQHPNMCVFWVDNQPRFSPLFDRIAYLQAGKIAKLEKTQQTETEQSSDTVQKGNSGARPLAESSIRSASSLREEEKLEVLKSIPLFRFLDIPQLMVLANNCDALDFAKGERLFSQGEPGNALYIILHGTADVLLTNGDSERQVRECGVNVVLGELSLLSNEPRTATVEARTNLVVLRLKREVFIDLIRTNGEMGYQILQVIASRFIENNRSMAAMAQS